MSTVDTEMQNNPVESEQAARKGTVIAFSALVFSVLQSMCTVAVALHGVQLALGVSSLLSAGAAGAMERFHGISWLRITLMVGAVLGSLLTLGITLKARSLRNRPASQWRRQPITAARLRMENIQIAISVLTLVLVVLEEYFHFRLAHTL